MITVLTAVESRDGLLKKTGEEFLRSVKLIESLDDELYAGAKKSNGSIGAHFRHNIEIVDNFLYGLKAGKIDYGNRERDIRIEQDRSYAIERIGYVIDGLHELPSEFFHLEVLVRSEIDLDTWHDSSATRELEFIHSHTVHHHAIIAEKLKAVGIEVSADFGVAPSTLEFWKRVKNNNDEI